MVDDIIVMTLSRWSLSNREEKPTMSEISLDILERFLDRKFRASRSYATKETYRGAINRFAEFAW